MHPKAPQQIIKSMQLPFILARTKHLNTILCNSFALVQMSEDPSASADDWQSYTYLRPDPGGAILGVFVKSFTAAQNLTAAERFDLVSSLYGPGNLTCWFLLLASVLLSWTVNPTIVRRDTITIDFIAMLTCP